MNPDASFRVVGIMLLLVALYFGLKSATAVGTGQDLIESIFHPAPTCSVASNILQAKHGVILNLINGQVQHGVLMCGATDGNGSRAVDFNWDYGGQSHSAEWLVSAAGVVVPGNDTAVKVEQVEKLGASFFQRLFP